MSTIALGLAAVGRPAYITLGRGADLGDARDVEAMQARAHALLDAAWAAGVRWFDAARSYGRAEEFLASWLRERRVPTAAVTVSSKWGYAYTGGWRMDAAEHEVKDLSAAQLARQWPQTRSLLGPWLDIYEIHSATVDSGVLDDPEVAAGLDRVRAAGVQIGLSVTGPGQGDTIDRAITVGGYDWVQATWNLLEPSAGPALARAKAAGMGVMVKEGVANGRLTAHGRPPERVEAAARERGVGVDAIALAAALAQPWADVVLSGAVTDEQLASNLVAGGVAWDDDLAALVGPLAEEPEAYWSTRSDLAWS
jgi:aryl-alcohol dehydrogenase-like predicted oxidoreductase